MSKNSLKKTVIFATDEGKKLIDNMLTDESSATARSVSGCLENHLLASLLPKNESAAMWITHMYQYNKTPGDVIASMAADLASMCSDALTVQDFSAILNYYRSYAEPIAKFSDLHEVNYLQAQASSITDDLRRAADDCLIPPDAITLANHIDHDITEAQTTLTLDVLDILDVCAYYPDVTRCNGRTYRMLAWLARHMQWANTPKSRYDVVCLARTYR